MQYKTDARVQIKVPAAAVRVIFSQHVGKLAKYLVWLKMF